jgi:hypothetical protein
MKINATVTFTFALLFLMLGASLASSMAGFSVGREALKGITQPDSRPNKGKAKTANNSAQKEGIALMKEEDIIKSMKERIDGSAKTGAARTDDKDKDNKDAAKVEAPKVDVKFPIVTAAQGVTMEVVSSRKEGEATMLDVTIKNGAAQPVQFRYTFLTVTDDQGRVVTAETIGLPSELPANSETFSGSVKLASKTLQGAKSVTLQLSDYPEQKVQLRVQDVPIQ